MKIPLRLEDDKHLIDTVCEIRFEVSNDVEKASVPSLILSHLQQLGEVRLQMTNENNIPFTIRNQDPMLKFAATHHATVDGYRYLFNERLISIAPEGDYPGWAIFFPKIEAMINTMKPKLMSSVSRVGYRSVDFFKGSMLGKCALSVDSPLPKMNSAQYTMVHALDGMSVRVVVGDQVSVLPDDSLGTIIDIDASIENDTSDLIMAIEKTHQLCKKCFFNLLQPKFIESKRPVYAED